ncbi:hypothetical protein K469DRAFT_268633 [Zopfia rhizophila CBS 207.26]|uniref:Uncharacterized protein n=1 Tax=Zopfia rhizophila CBS 207.26 TaxID=1314779 RepID=A0A6A6DRU4_9PEZI|nr:hypothetical protein K469DRAFT_268633 [Zopfia rhizophila CBS 207.26]
MMGQTRELSTRKHTLRLKDLSCTSGPAPIGSNTSPTLSGLSALPKAPEPPRSAFLNAPNPPPSVSSHASNGPPSASFHAPNLPPPASFNAPNLPPSASFKAPNSPPSALFNAPSPPPSASFNASDALTSAPIISNPSLTFQARLHRSRRPTHPNQASCLVQVHSLPCLAPVPPAIMPNPPPTFRSRNGTLGAFTWPTLNGSSKASSTVPFELPVSPITSSSPMTENLQSSPVTRMSQTGAASDMSFVPSRIVPSPAPSAITSIALTDAGTMQSSLITNAWPDY